MKEQFYVPLSDDRVLLEPLSDQYIEQMLSLSSDSDIWTWYTADLTDPRDLKSWMTNRLKETENEEKLSYAVLLKATKEVVGSTSYGHIDWKEKCIEIGWTWLGKEHIGSGLNKHMKFLMFRHAFETMGIERVELRTDEVNVRSRKAMEKVGATFDGTSRNHRTTQGGRRRNTVIYSILKSEWGHIRNNIFNEF